MGDALALLHWCSILNPDYICIPFLEQLTGFSKERLNDGISGLLRFSIIKRHGNLVQINQLTQNEVLQMMRENELQNYIERLAAYLQKRLFRIIPGTYAFSEEECTIMHAQWLLSGIKGRQICNAEASGCLHETVGEYLLRKGNLKAAKKHLEQAVQNKESQKIVHAFGCLALAFLYETEGRYQDMQQMFEKVRPWEEEFRRDFPMRYFELRRLEAYLYDDMQKERETRLAAEAAGKQLTLCKEELTEDEMFEHSMDLANIEGHVLVLENQTAIAEEKYYKIITDCRLYFKQSSRTIPAYAHAYCNLGHIRIQSSGNNEEAICLFKKAGDILKTLYGGMDHLDIAVQLTGLGWCYMNRNEDGDADRAGECFEEAFEMVFCRLGFKEHPYCAQICFMQSRLAMDHGRYQDACTFCSRGIEIAEKSIASPERSKLLRFLWGQRFSALFSLMECEKIIWDLKKVKLYLPGVKLRQRIPAWCKIQFMMLGTEFLRWLLFLLNFKNNHRK